MSRGVEIILFVLICGAGSAAAQQPSAADRLLQHMPCQAWTIMRANNWAGNSDEQIALEAWTVQYLRAYAKAATERLGKDAPKNADGSDVTDRQIVNWISTFCVKRPADPLIRAVFTLSVRFSLFADHSNLPPPP